MGGYHLVDGLHDGQHLVVGDLAVAVDVVELEGPVQLVLHLAPRRDGQRADELLKVDDAAVVGVEDAEDVVGKGRGVAKGEELAVDLLELLLGERARRAVLQEACTGQPAVPLSKSIYNPGGGGEQINLCTTAAAPSCQNGSPSAAPRARPRRASTACATTSAGVCRGAAGPRDATASARGGPACC